MRYFSAYVVALVLAVFSTISSAQFFGGIVAQGQGSTSAQTGSAGASQGLGGYYTYGTAGGVAGSTANASVTGPGLTFQASGGDGVLVGSEVGGVSGGNAAGGSAANAQGQASHYGASGFVISLP